MMRLKQWLSEHGVSAEQFGKDIGVSGQAVRRYSTGERMPEAAIVERISSATAGEVTVLDLHETRLEFIRAGGSES